MVASDISNSYKYGEGEEEKNSFSELEELKTPEE
jgi:hypothetical protein